MLVEETGEEEWGGKRRKKKQQEILKFNRHKSNTKNAPGLVPGSVPRIKDKQATFAAFGFWVGSACVMGSLAGMPGKDAGGFQAGCHKIFTPQKTFFQTHI